MITENLSTLKIHKLTKEQYNRELAAGNIDESALYLTPDESADLSKYATKEDIDFINTKVGDTSVSEQIADAINNLDIPEGFSGSWNDLKDKPFGEGTIKKYANAYDEGTSEEIIFKNLELTNDSYYYVPGMFFHHGSGEVKIELGNETYSERLYSSEDGVYGGYYGYIGDSSLSRVPFYITFNTSESTMRIKVSESILPTTFSLYREVNEIIALDSKFIGDDIARVAEVEAISDELDTLHTVATTGNWNDLEDKPFYDNTIVAFEEQTINSSYINADRRVFGYPAVETCTVVFDGKEYIGTVEAFWDDYTYENYVNIIFEEGILSTCESYDVPFEESHTVAVYIEGEFKTLDSKYLPEGIATEEYVNIRVPSWTSEDEGKFLRIVNGTPTWVTIPNAEGVSF